MVKDKSGDLTVKAQQGGGSLWKWYWMVLRTRMCRWFLVVFLFLGVRSCKRIIKRHIVRANKKNLIWEFRDLKQDPPICRGDHSR